MRGPASLSSTVASILLTQDSGSGKGSDQDGSNQAAGLNLNFQVML